MLSVKSTITECCHVCVGGCTVVSMSVFVNMYWGWGSWQAVMRMHSSTIFCVLGLYDVECGCQCIKRGNIHSIASLHLF